MHLKKVDIFGFKSFADKTEIHFEKGITCIVGPNGCGKSNISDAVRWVLGERSAKLLRGSKMEDVIFNGTEFRKPVNFADVSLTIDNSDKILPIGFDEVVLTRRLYRSRESEYLINKTPCRYKDIQDLILDTGIGSNSYSMIEQGRIDYILNAHEDERRFLIEEAAGISKYKLKKDEALRKLERAESNLLRLNDIVSEVEKNIKYAERQARRAERYKEKLDELKKFECQKAFAEIEQLDTENAALTQECAEISSLLQGGQKDLDGREEEFRQLDLKLSKLDEENTLVERRKYDLMLRLSQCEDKIRTNQERRTELLNTNQSLEKECSLSVYRLETFEEEHRRKANELVSLRAELEGMIGRVELSKQEYSLAQERVTEKERVVREYQSGLFDLARQMTDIRNRIHRLEIELETTGSRKIRAEELTTRLNGEREDAARKIDAMGNEPSWEADFKTKTDFYMNQSAEKTALESSARSFEERCAEKESQRKQIFSQIELLDELEKEGVFDDDVAIRIIEESRKDGSALHGLLKSVWDVLQVDAGYEGAARAILSDWAHMMIVEDPDQALRVINYARGIRAKSIAVTVKHSVHGLPEMSGYSDLPGFCGFLRNFVRPSEGYEYILNQYFDRIVVVDAFSPDHVQTWIGASSDARIVTGDGFIIGPGPRIQYLGGVVNSNAAARRKELKDLRNTLAQLEPELQQMQSEKDSARFRSDEFRREFEMLEKEYMEAKVQFQSNQRLKESLNTQITRLDDEILMNRMEAGDASQAIEKLAQDKSQLEAEWQRQKQKETADQELFERERQELNLSSQNKETLYRAFTEEEQKLERFRDRERYLIESIEMLEKNRQSEIGLQEKRQQYLRDNIKILSDIEIESEEKTREALILKQEIEVVTAESEKVAGERTSFNELRTRLYTELQRRKNEIDKYRERGRDIQLKQVQISYKQAAIEERVKQTYHVELKSLDKALFQIQNIDFVALEQDIQSLKEKLESIGTVNLLAIDEFNSLKERFDFLSAQKLDLEKSREDLLEAIRKINRTTKKLFEETFVQVQQNFKEYFRILFGGGEAELFLIDESNPLESGIDIMVRPPGKKNSTITLLSGGEKALTATALLFALFKIKPSPFCVLDEVDAPLDESNVHRLLEVLKEFLGKTQFIIVTHNRKTIAAGDSLYGITMEEAGVSKIVSVKLLLDDPKSTDAVEEDKQDNVELNEVLN